MAKKRCQILNNKYPQALEQVDSPGEQKAQELAGGGKPGHEEKTVHRRPPTHPAVLPPPAF